MPVDVAHIAAQLTKAKVEILDSRYIDYRFTMADVVADNTSAGRFVVGPVMPATDLTCGSSG